MARSTTTKSERPPQSPEGGLTDRQALIIRLLRQVFTDRRGTAVVPHRTRVQGIDLTLAIRYFRLRYSQGLLPASMVVALEGIPGWRWHPRKDDEVHFLAMLQAFVRRHGWGELRSTTVMGGAKIGQWVGTLRRAYRKGEVRLDLRSRLEAIPGWSWTHTRAQGVASHSHRIMVKHLDRLSAFYRSGRTKRLVRGTVFQGHDLCRSRNYLVKRFHNGTLPKEVWKTLESFPGWTWDHFADVRQRNIERLRKLARRHGGLPDVTSLTVIDRHRIGSWLWACWKAYRDGKLSAALVRELEAIPGWVWRRSRDDDYHRGLTALRKFLQEHELSEIYAKPIQSGVNIKNWVQSRRRAFVVGKKMPAWLIEELERLPNWSWTPKKDKGELRRLRRR